MAKPSAQSDQKIDIGVKLVLMFFISLFSFSLGTYVGKEVSDADHQRTAREVEYNSEAHTASAPQEHGDEATEVVKDEEVASLTEEFMRASRNTASETPAKEEPVTPAATPKSKEDGYTHHSKITANRKEAEIYNDPAPATTEHPSPVAHAAPKEKPAAVTKTEPTKTEPTKVDAGVNKAAERVSSGLAPAADPAKKREPTTALPSVATTAIGKYTVQVASYVTAAEAEAFAEKLLGKGYPAFVVTADVAGKTWYRVSVGRFPDQNAAKVYRTELLASQAVGAAVVQKVIQ